MSNDQENQNQPQPEPSSRASSIRCKPNESEQQTSDIWNHFRRVDHWRVACNYCDHECSGYGVDAEEIIGQHLLDHHPEALEDDDDEGEEVCSPCETFGSGCFVFDEEVARKELALAITRHGYPTSIVNDIGFRRLSQSLQPLFKLDRRTVEKDILEIYNDEKSKTMEMLSKIESRVAITTDMWSSSNQDKHYMAIRAHFIDDSMTLQSRMLRFVYVPIPLTEDVLSNVIVQCLKNWNLDTKLSTLTVDSCGTSDATFECVLNKISPRSLILGGQLFRMRCCNHILNLIVKDGLSIISDTVEKVRECVEFWTAAPDREEKFEEACNQLNIPYVKKLVLDCEARWVSTFLMLNAAIPYKEVFHHLTQEQPQRRSLPSEDEWDIQAQNMSLPSEDEWNLAKEICQKLEMFYDLAKLFFGTVSPTPNVYFKKVCEVRLALTKWLSCSDAIIQQMASSMIAKLDNYWSGINEVMAVGVVLDPRYKMVLLDFLFPRIYGENACHEIEKVKTVCQNLFMEYENKFKEIETSSSSSRTIVTNTSSAGGNDWDSKFDEYLAKRTASKNTKSELDQYLDAKVLKPSLSRDLDILTWWKVNGFGYPTLRRIARDFLAIPASTVASESTFGTSGRFLTPHRSELHRKHVEALMCTQDWLGFSGMDFESDIE